MRERVEWTASESLPARADVLHLQGLGADVEVPPRIAALLDDALKRYLKLAEPRAVIADIAIPDFAHVYVGDGHNAHETPLERIYPQAAGLALMAATVGPRLTIAVRDLFDRHDVALGCMLDAVGSAAADHLACLLSARYAEMQGSAAVRVLAYSPGYCGWHVSGQRALFHYLKPEDVGISLNTSCLMQPLKSVSGVLVAGPAGIHKFHPTYSFCETCQQKQCRDRMASVLRGESRS